MEILEIAFYTALGFGLGACVLGLLALVLTMLFIFIASHIDIDEIRYKRRVKRNKRGE